MICSFCDTTVARMICLDCSEFCCEMHIDHLCTPLGGDDIITVMLNIIDGFSLDKPTKFFNLYKIHYQAKWVHR